MEYSSRKYFSWSTTRENYFPPLYVSHSSMQAVAVVVYPSCLLRLQLQRLFPPVCNLRAQISFNLQPNQPEKWNFLYSVRAVGHIGFTLWLDPLLWLHGSSRLLFRACWSHSSPTGKGEKKEEGKKKGKKIPGYLHFPLWIPTMFEISRRVKRRFFKRPPVCSN